MIGTLKVIDEVIRNSLKDVRAAAAAAAEQPK